MKTRTGLWFFPLLCLLGEWASARAGGGHSYSGSHSSGGGYHGGGGYSGGGGYGGGYGNGGGGGGGVGQLIYLILRLTFDYPLVGIPLDLFIIWLVIKLLRSRDNEHAVEAVPAPRVAAYRRGELDRLREEDPYFSFPFFADFTYSLFSEVQKARGAGKLANYTSYLSNDVITKLQVLSGPLQEVRGIVIGGWHIQGARDSASGDVEILVEIEANYSEIKTGQETRWFTTETWSFTRAAGVKSKPPGALKTIGCPNCGAPLAYSTYRVCKSCGQKIDGGQFSWFVRDVYFEREIRPPQLTSDAPEEGTDLPTQYSRDYEAQFASYKNDHPEFDLAAFLDRTAKIFYEIQKAWSERKLELARPYETDRLFQSHLYWIEEYKRQGLRNALSRVKISRIEPVGMVQDAFVSSLTVRIFASMIDTTVNERGQILTGDAKTPREFSEYWTFIRGQTAPGKAITPFGVCPSCGAPMKVGMAGTCEYCGNQITTGDYDWVLSLIEQDEAYQA